MPLTGSYFPYFPIRTSGSGLHGADDDDDDDDDDGLCTTAPKGESVEHVSCLPST